MRTIHLAILIATLCGSAAPVAAVEIKDVLFIRIDFPDKEGEPISVENARALVEDTAGDFFVANSNGQVDFAATVTDVIRMPESSGSYGSDPKTTLRVEAFNALEDSGFDTSGYDFYVYATKKIGGSAGLNGGSWIILNGHFNLSVFGHEMGHAFGAGHANTWKVVDGSPITEGEPGTMSTEYGNKYDLMGGGSKPVHHFNTMVKHGLGWIPEADVPLISETGTYTINAHDDREADGRRALRISRGVPEGSFGFEYIYWIEFRDAIDHDDIRNGAVLSWQRKAHGLAVLGKPSNHLLDMTPGTSTHSDHPLRVGETFRDDEVGFEIEVLRRIEGAQPALEVQVRFDGDPPSEDPPGEDPPIPPNPDPPTRTITIVATDAEGTRLGTGFALDGLSIDPVDEGADGWRFAIQPHYPDTAYRLIPNPAIVVGDG